MLVLVASLLAGSLLLAFARHPARVATHTAGRRSLRDERGMTTETVIITAVLAALALGATAIIVQKVTTKAESIPTESTPGPPAGP